MFTVDGVTKVVKSALHPSGSAPADGNRSRRTGVTARLRVPFIRWLLRPLLHLLLDLHVAHPQRLQLAGPAIVCANHNSHLDSLVLLSLFPACLLPRVRPVAAADYFLRNPLLAWVATTLIGIIPIDRDARARGLDPLAGCHEALARGDILLLFPEGTRGEPERRQPLRKGVAWLLEQHPDVPVVPVFLHGLGKALPRGAALPVPFACGVAVGETLAWRGCRETFMQDLESALQRLAADRTASRAQRS
jgi:1-acyl-sn-glycerol-3-phosphate acyltransferase